MATACLWLLRTRPSAADSRAAGRRAPRLDRLTLAIVPCRRNDPRRAYQGVARPSSARWANQAGPPRGLVLIPAVSDRVAAGAGDEARRSSRVNRFPLEACHLV